MDLRYADILRMTGHVAQQKGMLCYTLDSQYISQASTTPEQDAEAWSGCVHRGKTKLPRPALFRSIANYAGRLKRGRRGHRNRRCR